MLERGGHFVIVAINMGISTGASTVSQPFEIRNQSLSSLVPHQTTASATVAFTLGFLEIDLRTTMGTSHEELRS